MTKSEQVRARVDALMAEGVSRPDAFKRLTEELGAPLGTIRGAYYSKRGDGSSRPRRRATAVEDALADARAALERAVGQIDREVAAAKERADEARAEHDELKASATARKAALARASSGRRRFVDPATCERDYSAAEMEFLDAIQEYKRTSGRMFPTWSEVLEVVRGLGYEKASA